MKHIKNIFLISSLLCCGFSVHAMKYEPYQGLVAFLQANKDSRIYSVGGLNLSISSLQRMYEDAIETANNQKQLQELGKKLSLSSDEIVEDLESVKKSINNIRLTLLSVFVKKKDDGDVINYSRYLSADDSKALSLFIQEILESDELLQELAGRAGLNREKCKQYLIAIQKDLGPVLPRIEKVLLAKTPLVVKKEIKSLKPEEQALVNRFPTIFNQIPKEYHTKAIAAGISRWMFEEDFIEALKEKSKSLEGQRELTWKLTGDMYSPPIQKTSFSANYVFFYTNPDADARHLLEDSALKEKLGDLRLKTIMNMWILDDEDEQLKKKLINELAGVYKIHLMPAPGTDLTKLIVLIINEFSADPELKNLITLFKVSVLEDKDLREYQVPRFVFYTEITGTMVAQKALDKIYAIFKKHPEIKGSGDRPRYNGKVNDLIWIAQGNGDDKKIPENEQYFEQPLMIYYKPDFTGTVKNYHLKNPETGKEIID